MSNSHLSQSGQAEVGGRELHEASLFQHPQGRSDRGAPGSQVSVGLQRSSGDWGARGTREDLAGWFSVGCRLCELWPWHCRAQDPEAGEKSPTHNCHLTREEKQLWAAVEERET